MTPDHLLALLLRWGGKVSLAELRDAKGGVLLPPTRPGTFLAHRVMTRDRKVNLAPKSLLEDAKRLAVREDDLAREDVLRLVGRRDRRSHNSWMHNNRHIRQPEGNDVLLNPDDAAARGIIDGSLVEVRSPVGAITLPARLSDDVRRGVVVVPHGWGHAGSSAVRARSLPGANVNDVIPGGTNAMDPVSGQAIILAHVVEVRPVSSPSDDPPDEPGSG